jgi:hypothetical protein
MDFDTKASNMILIIFLSIGSKTLGFEHNMQNNPKTWKFS